MASPDASAKALSSARPTGRATDSPGAVSNVGISRRALVAYSFLSGDTTRPTKSRAARGQGPARGLDRAARPTD